MSLLFAMRSVSAKQECLCQAKLTNLMQRVVPEVTEGAVMVPGFGNGKLAFTQFYAFLLSHWPKP